MKKISLFFLGFVILALTFTSCKKDNQVSVKKTDAIHSTGTRTLALANVTSNADLIAYKNSSHKLTVGYFNELEKIGDAGKGYTDLSLVPDSVDAVCIFTNMSHNNTTLWGKATVVNAAIAALHAKGTKVYNDIWLSDFDGYKHADGTPFQHNATDYDSFAHAIYNYLAEWNVDGVALDMEPGIVYTASQNAGLANAFAKYFGVQSTNGKALILDTNQSLSSISATMGLTSSFINANVNYLWVMDYNGSMSSTNNKIDGYISGGYPSSKIMEIAADFEADYNNTTTSYGPLRLKSYYTNSSILAKVNGFGAYGFNHDQTQNYKYCRAMIQALNPSGGSSTGIISGNTYTLISAVNNSSVLDVAGGGTANGTKVQLYQSKGTAAQKWLFTSVGNGYYTLTPTNAAAERMDVTDAATTNGTQIQIWTSNGNVAQNWKPVSLGNGYYKMVSGLSATKVLDNSGQGTSNGNKIQLYDDNGTVAQQWKLVKQ